MTKRKLTKPRALSPSAIKMLGASDEENAKARLRVLDGYHTPRIAVTELLQREKFQHRIWEPANGFNRITRVLQRHGHRVHTSDIKLWSRHTQQELDFCRATKLPFHRGCDIITNPPFRRAEEFINIALKLLPEGGKLALLLRIQFLEGVRRKKLYQTTPPARVWVFSYRLPRMHRFLYQGKKSTSTICFCWFIWRKGYNGKTQLNWI